MHSNCITAVRAAANGRSISQSKLKLIEDAVSQKMRDLARLDPQRWQSLSKDQRVIEASQAATEEIKAEAARTEYLGILQILRTDETNARVESLQQLSAMNVTRSQALVRDIQNTHNQIHAVHDSAVSGLRDLLDAAEAKDGTGVLRNLGIRIFDMDNPKMTADVVREVFANADGRTGNKLAQKGAEAYLKTIENLRLRFNAAGGDIGKLGYGYLSQIHDSARIIKTSATEWAGKTLPLLDRNQYLREDGSLMSDVELLPILERVHETLASNGLNKIEPGQYRGIGKRANAGSDHRVLHFKDGDAWMAYMQQFGEGTLYDAMIGHVGHMTRNIGLVEHYGPNPEMQFRLQADIAERADGRGTMANRSVGNTPDGYWQILSGKTRSPENLAVSTAFQNARNVQTAAKLGSAVITSISDIGTVGATLHYNRLPYFSMLSNIGRNISKDHRDFLQSHGIIAEHLTSTLNRFTGDNMTHSLTGRIANSVMKLSLMNAWTDGLRSAFSATMMQGFVKKVGKPWAKLDAWDRFLMERKGITEADWAVISKATPTERSGIQYLTRDSILATGHDSAQQVATKWMAFVSDEAQFAVVNPDMAVRAIVTGGGMPAGTVRGEAMRTFMQFKSFPLAMMTRHWGRVFDTPQGMQGAPAGFGAHTATGGTVNRIAVLAGLNVSLMMLGAAALQIKATLAGKDPYDMTEGKFWTRSLTQGGGMGYVGDLIFKDPTEQRGSNMEQTAGSVLGPTAGAAAGLAGDLIVTNAWQAAKGKDMRVGAESLRWVNSQLPGTSLWQVRGAWDHWFLHNAQEALNPGYLNRMRQRAMTDWGQGYYWEPGQPLPDRAPDFSHATGR